MNDGNKWRGLNALVRDMVEHGSRAVEKIQRTTAKRTFVVLEQLPAIAPTAQLVHVIHDTSVATTHLTIRWVTRGVSAVVDKVLVATEEP